jgi:hypothetical protein
MQHAPLHRHDAEITPRHTTSRASVRADALALAGGADAEQGFGSGDEEEEDEEEEEEEEEEEVDEGDPNKRRRKPNPRYQDEPRKRAAKKARHGSGSGGGAGGSSAARMASLGSADADLLASLAEAAEVHERSRPAGAPGGPLGGGAAGGAAAGGNAPLAPHAPPEGGAGGLDPLALGADDGADDAAAYGGGGDAGDAQLPGGDVRLHINIVAPPSPVDLSAVHGALQQHASGVAATVAGAFGEEGLQRVREQLDAENARLQQSLATTLSPAA